MRTAQHRKILSIVLCTQFKTNSINKCLNELRSQITDNSAKCELIIVYNGELERLPEFRKLILQSNKFARIVIEPNKGLSQARNLGFRSAQGNYVAYIDDDAYPGKNWIKNLIIFIESNPDVKVFGGPYSRYSNKPIPMWLPKNYGNHSLGNKVREISIGKEWLNGTNFIVRKDLLVSMGGFDIKLGMKEELISYGEETKLQVLINRNNIKILYVPSIMVYHLIRDEKLLFIWHLKSFYASGYSLSKALCEDNSINFIVKYYGLLPINLMRAIFKKNSDTLPIRMFNFFSYLTPFIGAIAFYLENKIGNTNNA